MLPFFKAVGGKRALAPTILPLLDLDHRTSYVEPFLGGGAVFLAVREAGFRGSCVVNDSNPHLMATWRAVQEDPDGVLRAFQRYADQDSREFFYSVRQSPPTNTVEAAGWFLYLNKRAFNGLWRVNSKGLFNVPYGDYKSPPTVDANALWDAHRALHDTTLMWQDFEKIPCPDGAAIYFDPPYIPVSKTANFTGYTPGGFLADDQIRLAKWCRSAADKHGARVVLSNAGNSDSSRAFASIADRVIEVQERRVINRDGGKRGPIAAHIYIFGGQS